MKYHRIYFIISLVIVFTACKPIKERKYKDDIFPQEILNQLPNIEDTTLNLIYRTWYHYQKTHKREVKPTFLIKAYYYDSSLKVTNYKHTFSVKSTNYFILDDIDLLKTIHGNNFLKEKYSNLNINNIVPNFKCHLPNMYGLENILCENTTCGLKNDFNIFILDSGNKFILDTKNKVESNILSKQLAHGHNCGLAYSKEKNIVIYWILAW